MDTQAVLNLAVELGYQVQIAGGEIYRVEESVGRLMAAYGISSGEVFAIPNCLTVSLVTREGQTLTRIRRIPAHGTDIWRLEAMNGLCRRLCRQPMDPEEAMGELEALVDGERTYPWWVLLPAYFLGAGAFTLFFGGNGWDALSSGVCGVAIGLCLRGMERLGANLFIKTMAGGGASALLALFFTYVGFGRSVDLITIGALMILVPGVALTNAVRDVMVGDMVSGVSKLAEAVLIAVAIALGTGLALSISHLLGRVV